MNDQATNETNVRENRRLKQYAIYKGDKFIALGTAKELANMLGVSIRSIHWMTSPTCHKRNVGGKKMEAIVIEDDEIAE